MCLPHHNLSNSLKLQNRFIIDELNYDKEEMEKIHQSLFKSRTDE